MESAQTTRQNIYEDFLAKLSSGENFAFSRFGDGEWSCIFGAQGENCDGSTYLPTLAKRLSEVLANVPAYYVGLQPKAFKEMGPRIEEWCKKHEIPDGFWIDADCLHVASINERLSRFWDALRGRNIVVVGPVWLRLIPAALLQFTHVTVPAVNAWFQYDIIRARLQEHIEPNCVVLVSMGMGGKVMIHELYDGTFTMIDTGSALDYYAGVHSRFYHRAMHKEDAGAK